MNTINGQIIFTERELLHLIKVNIVQWTSEKVALDASKDYDDHWEDITYDLSNKILLMSSWHD
jgi:hypothetical protein